MIPATATAHESTRLAVVLRRGLSAPAAGRLQPDSPAQRVVRRTGLLVHGQFLISNPASGGPRRSLLPWRGLGYAPYLWREAGEV